MIGVDKVPAATGDSVNVDETNGATLVGVGPDITDVEIVGVGLLQA